MPRVAATVTGTEKPKREPRVNPLDGLDYTVEKTANGRWRAECLGKEAYGTTKKMALAMLVEELSGFQGQSDNMPEVLEETVVVRGVVMQKVAPVPMPPPSANESAKPKAEYSIEDAEILWEVDYPNKPDLLRQMFQERIVLKQEQDRTKARIDEINNSLLGFMERQGVDAVKWEDWKLARVAGANVTLDKEALVLAGVPAETIAKCTKRKEFTTVRVTGPKGE